MDGRGIEVDESFSGVADAKVKFELDNPNLGRAFELCHIFLALAMDRIFLRN